MRRCAPACKNEEHTGALAPSLDMTKSVQVLRSKSNNKQHGPITGSDLSPNGLIRACDWSTLFGFAFARNTLTHFVIQAVPFVLPILLKWFQGQTAYNTVPAGNCNGCKALLSFALEHMSLASSRASAPLARSAVDPARASRVRGRASAAPRAEGLADIARHVIACHSTLLVEISAVLAQPVSR